MTVGRRLERQDLYGREDQVKLPGQPGRLRPVEIMVDAGSGDNGELQWG